MDLFSLYARISLDPSDFERGLDTASKKFKSFSDNIKSISDGFGKVSSGLGDLLSPVVKGFELTEGVGKKAGSAIVSVMKGLGAASTAAAGGAVAVGKSAFDAYANYEQLVGGVETLFGAGGQSLEEYAKWERKTVDEVADKYNELMRQQNYVMEDAAEAYKTAGMSANEYMETVTGFAASLKQSLGDEHFWEISAFANEAVVDMADNANKMGTDIERIQDAYQGFAKQNFTMLDNLKLGYGGTKTEMERLLRDAEKLEGFYEGSMSTENFADIVMAIHAVQVEMGIAGTTAKEASTTIQGSVASMKGAWENFMVGIADSGQDMGALVDNLVGSVVTAGNNVVPRIKEIVEQVIRVGPEVIRGFSEIIPEFARMGGEIVETLASGLSAQVPALMEFGSKAVGWIADGIRNNGASVGNSITGFLTDAVDMIGSQSGRLIEAGVVIKNSIASGFENLIGAVAPYISEFVPLLASSFMAYHETLFTVGLDILGAIGQGLTQNKDEIKTVTTETIYSMVTALRDNAPAIIEGGVALLEALVGAIMENMPMILATGAEIIGQLVAGISTASPAVQAIIGTAVLPHILKIIDVAGGIGEVFSGVFALVKDGIGAVMDIGGKLMGGIQSLFGLIMAHPVVAVVTAIIAAVVLLWQNCEEFRDAVGAIWDAIVGFFQKAAELIKAAFDGVVDFFAGIWQGIQDIFSTVVEVLGGVFEAAASAVKTAWDAIVSFFQTIWDGIRSVFSTVAEVLGEIFQSAADAVQSAWDAVVGFFTDVWEGIKGAFSTAVEVLGGFFSDAWSAIESVWGTVKGFFTDIADGIRSAFETATEFLGNTFETAWEAVNSAWENAVSFFGDVWAGISGWFQDTAGFFGEKFAAARIAVESAWDNITEFFSGIWEDIKGVFADVWDTFKEIGGNILSGLWEGVSGALGWVKEKIGGVVDGIVGFFTDGLDIHSPSRVMADIGKNVMLGLGEGIEGENGSIGGNIKDIIATMKDAFKDLAGYFNEIGSNAMSSLANAMSSGISALQGKVKSLMDGITAAAKAALGIHSPSKVFAGIGENMALGLAEGWDDEYSGIKRQIENGLNFGTTTIGVTAVGTNRDSGLGNDDSAKRLGTGNNFNFMFNSPKALDPVSAAREAKKAAQQMASAYL